MALNFDVNSLVRGNVVWLIALSGKSRPGQSSTYARSGKDVAHTQEVSHTLLDLADLIRGKIPDVLRRIATKAEITEGDLGVEDGLSESGFQTLRISWCLMATSVCDGRIVSRGVMRIIECVRSHNILRMVSAVA